MTVLIVRVWLTFLIVIAVAACAPATLPADPAATPSAEPPAAASVTPSTGSASNFADAEGVRSFRINPAVSTASYRAYEEFFGRSIRTHAPFTLPIGQTNPVTGTIGVAPTNDGLRIEPNVMTVNLFQLTSDDARRDKAIRANYLQSEAFPLATFVPEEIENFPPDYAPGDTATFQMHGAMTIRDITNPASFDVTAILADDVISATATTQILMPDYGFAPPRMQTFVIVQDQLDVTVRIQAAEVSNTP